ncbi:MAG: F0F1 ATP synthase subunit alpha [Candidatus Levybacteria bacterium RIFCSPLOWO2_02_FULL_37_10]|nr:MAG: F0F1 ATP synthase subunit alpha [Candidatus Levybacteria bacterium RIFCSPHIGHO2_01_FULL_37_33]OGH17465.1 MAG: F0F1 ATP synthase subunit alpha [Candidatus Levybacteria bacterium RIFCSPHIGHO2_02_FULL_37_11]OGH33177.1 MAG: F0F1 ATP synthase subunit alpha [Candidatus Levybacteria bacterium RIFCSPLOWO2_01_FULL_36_54]OGH46056.1 MAG: F0F1 ATP synthase subunit alpha [Candidatus Levybacteria bacterium RIFCSPLOWO2_02_FULL_37_10]
MTRNEEIIKELEKNLMTFSQGSKTKNIGTVEKNSDGVIIASGLSLAFMGEQVEFENGEKGMILNLDEDHVSIILFEGGEDITEGDRVKTTGKILSIIGSEKLIGRIVSPLGEPLDGKAGIKSGKSMPLEKIAPGVIQREPVNIPLKTGIKLIDAIIPIGRGQRELIIGDRALGKTAIAVDAIINQKPQKNSKFNPVICIYVAIGQKQSTVAQVIEKLKEAGSMDYTIVVSATASDAVALQYLAPYAGVAIAEYFMEKGEDVLIIYDDLSKHAWAYRQISLVLKRPAGREAYPGDIFYLHSRLLERAVKLNKEFGGGSITALPIVETQANDISAYIPTNIISITDGQIYLQSDLFNAGIRPAVNIGSSVSRVGGAAQTSAIKFTSGKMKLELAQYRELAVFAQFGSELDQATLSQLERGKRMTEVLKQPQYQPLAESLQILSIWAVTSGLLDDIPVESVRKFESEYHNYMQRNNPEIVKTLSTGEKPSEETIKKMEKATGEFKKIFSL